MDIPQFSISCRRLLLAAMILPSLGFISNVQAQVVLAESTFDNSVPDFDGWRAFECLNFGLCPVALPGVGGEVGEETAGSATFLYEPTGGNPNPARPFPGGGALHGTDPASGSTVLFHAPDKFTDNLKQGTTLMLDTLNDGLNYETAGFGLVPIFYVSNFSDQPPAGSPDARDFTLLYAVVVGDAPVNTWLEHIVNIVPNSEGPGLGKWYKVTTTIEEDSGSIFDTIFGGGAAPSEFRVWGELTADDPDFLDGVFLDNVKLTAPIPVPAALPLLISALAGLGFAARRKV